MKFRSPPRFRGSNTPDILQWIGQAVPWMEEIKAGLYRLDLNENFLASTSSSSATGLSAISPINITGTILSHDASGVTPGTYRSVAVNATGHVTSGSNPVIDISSGTNLAVTTPIVLTGDTLSHATSGVGAGTYRSVTVDTLGHVTAGSNPTIDISGDTNLAVTSPIVLTGDTLSFSFATNNTWTGTNLFQNDVSIQDTPDGTGPYLNIGDNSQSGGYISIQNDQFNTGNVVVNAQSGFAGEIYFDDSLGMTVEGNLKFGTVNHLTYGEFGSTLTNAIVTAAGSSDGFSAKKQSTSAAIRGMTVQAEYHNAGGGTMANAINGFNAFAYDTKTTTANLTVSTTGGGLRNRSVARHRGTGTVTKMSAGSFSAIQDASAGTTAEAIAVNIEVPSIGSASTVTAWKGLNIEAGSISGTATNAYGIFVSALSHGTNRFEQWMDSDAGIFFRAAGQQIYSSAASTLDIDTTTTLNFRVGTAIEATLAANALTFNNGASDVVLGWGTSGRLDVTATAGTIVSNNLTVNGGAIVKLSNFTSYATGYDLSVQSNGGFTYIEILNSYGSGAGAFFGMEGTGVEGDVFSLWNYQGGPIFFYTAPTAIDGTVAFHISEDGHVGLQTDKKLYLEMGTTGTFGDTYISYASGSSKVQYYVNGVLAMELE